MGEVGQKLTAYAAFQAGRGASGRAASRLLIVTTTPSRESEIRGLVAALKRESGSQPLTLTTTIGLVEQLGVLGRVWRSQSAGGRVGLLEALASDGAAAGAREAGRP